MRAEEPTPLTTAFHLAPPGMTWAVCLLSALVGTTVAQVNYNGGGLSENFDALPASGAAVAWADNATLPGWYAWRAAAAAPPASILADDGSSSSVSVVRSYGANGLADRALGSLAGATPGNFMVAVRLRNNTATTFTSFTLRYDGEQWRSSSSAARTLAFAWTTDAVANLNDPAVRWRANRFLNFSSPVTSGAGIALDGNAAPNRKASILSIVSGLSWAPGTDLWIRFTNPSVSGGNHGLAIDNFAFSAGTDPLAGYLGEAIDSVSDVDNELASGGAGLTVRDLPRAALIALELDYPDAAGAAAKARGYLDAMFTRQDMAPGSATYGHFAWDYADTAPLDLNSTEFCFAPLSVLLARHARRLGADYVQSIRPRILAGLAASRARTVGPDYTNIATMRLVNWLLLGEVLDDPASRLAGREALGAWLAEVGQSTFAEYDSPVYSLVTYANLVRRADLLSDPVSADTLRAAADLLAAGMAANYFPGQQRLGGSRSRDGDFLNGNGPVDHFHHLLGLRPRLPSFGPQNEGIYLYLGLRAGGHEPPADVLALASSRSLRAVKSRWGPAGIPGEDRYHFLTPDFSIGSSGAYYGSSQDKAIAADLAAASALPQVSLVFDPHDSPYGNVTTPDSTGHLKPNHLLFRSANVQEMGTILGLASLAPSFVAGSNFLGPYATISSAFVFPAQAEAVYLDGNLLDPAPGSVVAASSGSVLGIKQGNGVLAARFIQADGLGGQAPSFAVKFDGPGGSAARFVAYHYAGPARSFDRATDRPVVATLLAARSCPDAAAVATFLAEVAAAPATVTNNGTQAAAMATLAGTSLETRMDRASGQILARRVNGADYAPSMFSVGDGGAQADDIFGGRFLGMIESGWVQRDIGSFSPPSTATFDVAARKTTVTSRGADFRGTNDQGSFTWRTVTGDCDVVVRVDSKSDSNPWAKAGVMIRESLEDDARCAYALITPGNGARFSYRAAPGASASRTGITGIAAPYWLRLVRKGDSFSCYARSDAGPWVQMGVTRTIPMGRSVYVGFAVASASASTSSTAVFSGFSCERPFDSWAGQALAGFSAERRAPAADADGDGMSNFSEYALGCDPAAPDAVSPATTGRTPDGRLTLTFPRARANITYTVQWSEDLASWQNLIINPGSAGQTVEVADTVSNPARRFLRLKITEP